MISQFDTLLRRLYGIREFTGEEGCILRLALKRSDREITLSDGTKIRKGEPFGELHLWNERLPPIPKEGPDLAWGLQFHRLFRRSLVLLAEYVDRNPRWEGVTAFRGESALDARGLEEAFNLTGRLGFDLIPLGRYVSPVKPLLEFWENIYLWALIWAFNPASLKDKELIHLQRCQIWISRQALIKRYARKKEVEDI